MTIDERIQALTMHLEVLSHMHNDFEQRMTQYSADVRDAITRLAAIADSHRDLLNDHTEAI